MIYTDSSNCVYTVRRIDTTELPEARSHMHFEICVKNTSREQKIFVGLLETTAIGMRSDSPGIGISIDPETGLIMDLVNQQGVIGYLENAPLAVGKTYKITVDVEVIRHVYLPRITVGTETFLHPALFLKSNGKLSALVGSAVAATGTPNFDNPRFEVHQGEPLNA